MALLSCVSSRSRRPKALPNKEELKTTDPETVKTPSLMTLLRSVGSRSRSENKKSAVFLHLRHEWGWMFQFHLVMTLIEPVARYKGGS